MANKFCNACGLPRHVCYGIVKFDRFYRDVRRNVAGCSQVCGVSFGVACWAHWHEDFREEAELIRVTFPV
jgi:hypothetical protein